MMTSQTAASCAVLLLTGLLQACAIDDDFGRYHEPQLRGEAADVVGSIQEHTGILSRKAAFHIPLTNDEHTLRQTYLHFRKPFLARPKLREPLATETFTGHRTVDSYNQYVMHNIKSDRHWLRLLSKALGSVINQDQQRYEVVASSYDITDNDSRYIRVRIRENRGIALRLVKFLDKRIADYDQSIDYARVHFQQRDLLALSAPMDQLRSEIGIFKGRYEAYVFERGAKTDMHDYNSASK